MGGISVGHVHIIMRRPITSIVYTLPSCYPLQQGRPLTASARIPSCRGCSSQVMCRATPRDLQGVSRAQGIVGLGRRQHPVHSDCRTVPQVAASATCGGELDWNLPKALQWSARSPARHVHDMKVIRTRLWRRLRPHEQGRHQQQHRRAQGCCHGCRILSELFKKWLGMKA